VNTIREVVTKWIYLSRVFSTTRAGQIEQLGFGNKVLFPTTTSALFLKEGEYNAVYPF